MKTWLISITALCLLLITMELMLGEGKTKKYIQGILRLTVILVMITPIFSIISTEKIPYELIDYTETTENNNIYEGEYITLQIETTLKRYLNDMGGDCDVTVNITNGMIDTINVYVNKNGINNHGENIYTIEKIRNKILENIEVEKEKIFVYGAE